MKKALIGYKVVLVIFVVIILVIAALSILPVARGDISVEPVQEGVDWEIKDNELTAKGKVWMNNSGNFDLEDIELDLNLEILQKLYVNSTKEVGEIKVGEERLVTLSFSKDIEDISDEVMDHLIHNQTDINISVGFRGKYTFSLFTFDVTQEDTLSWGGLIETLEYNPEEADISKSGENYLITVPVQVSTNDVISGTVDINSDVSWETDVSPIATDQTSIELGTSEDFDLTFEIDQNEMEDFIDRSGTLIFTSQMVLRGSDFSFDLERTIDYTPVLEDYQFHTDNATLEESTGTSDYLLNIPYNLKTNENDFLSGSIELTTVMENKTGAISSSDQISITLGEDRNSELKFQISESGVESLITNSQEIQFSYIISKDDLTLTSSRVFEWGAPMNDLRVENLEYDRGSEVVSGNIRFKNDSPDSVNFDLTLTIYNQAGDVIGEKTSSFTAEAGENFDEEIQVSIDSGEVPYEGEMEIQHEGTGYTYTEVHQL